MPLSRMAGMRLVMTPPPLLPTLTGEVGEDTAATAAARTLPPLTCAVLGQLLIACHFQGVSWDKSQQKLGLM